MLVPSLIGSTSVFFICFCLALASLSVERCYSVNTFVGDIPLISILGQWRASNTYQVAGPFAYFFCEDSGLVLIYQKEESRIKYSLRGIKATNHDIGIRIQVVRLQNLLDFVPLSSFLKIQQCNISIKPYFYRAL